VPEAQLTVPKPVWVRSSAMTESCPKSSITAQSLEWLEEFAAWRGGYLSKESLTARQIQAFQLLEEEVAGEARHAKQSSGRNLSQEFDEPLRE